jgi:uncharacterized protein YoxC
LDDDVKGIYKLLKTVAATTDRTEQRVENLATTVDERFQKVDERFDAVDRRFVKIDERFDNVETLTPRSTSCPSGWVTRPVT